MAKKTKSTGSAETSISAGPAKQPKTQQMPAADFDALKKRVDAIVTGYSTRDADFTLYENAYKLNPTDSASGRTSAAQARLMFDPQGHNVIDAIVRMYMVNTPTISVVPSFIANTGFDQGQAQAEREERERIGKIESWLRAAVYASDLASTSDFLADSLYAAGIYGEVPQIIDMAIAQETGLPNTLVEAPFIFFVPHPRMSYPVYTRRNNLIQHVVKTQVYLAEIRATYGIDNTAFITGQDDFQVTLVDYIDMDKHVVWVDEFATEPILFANLAHGFIPRTSRRSTSPGFFDEEEYKRMPILFAYIKAGLWAARNVLLTATYSNVVDFMNPLMLMKKKAGGTAPIIDWSKRGSVVDIEVGEELGPLSRSSVTPEIFQFVQRVAQLVDESTMANITAMPRGGKSGATPSSALNVLTSSARVATYMIARTVEVATAQTLSKCLRWIKARGDLQFPVWGPEGKLVLTASDIMDNYHVNVNLKPDMQAEKQMVAGLAATLFERLHLGYDTTLTMLEEAGVIDSAEEAFNNIVERAFLEGELPNIVKNTSDYAKKVLGITQQIPSSQSPQNPAQPQMPARPAQAIPPAEGAVPGAIPGNFATGTQRGPIGGVPGQ